MSEVGSSTWDGLIRLNLTNYPQVERRHRLSFLDEKNYVEFDHSFPASTPNTLGTNNNGQGDLEPPAKPTVVWTLARREPACIGPKPFGPGKELKPRVREMLKDPQVDGYTVTVLGQYFDNIIQFDAIHSDNNAVNALADWFEQFMSIHRWILRKEGVEQIFFWMQKADETSRVWRQPMPIRSLQYYLKTEELEVHYERDLLYVNTTLDVASSVVGGGKNIGLRYIADQLASGELPASGYRRFFYDQSGHFMFGDLTLNH